MRLTPRGERVTVVLGLLALLFLLALVGGIEQA